MTESESLRLERLALLIGQMVGQISEIMNNIRNLSMTNEMIYKSLLDIMNASSLYLNEIYYREKENLNATQEREV